MCAVKTEFKTYTVKLRKINHIKQAQIENITQEISQEIGPNLASLYVFKPLIRYLELYITILICVCLALFL